MIGPSQQPCFSRFAGWALRKNGGVLGEAEVAMGTEPGVVWVSRDVALISRRSNSLYPPSNPNRPRRLPQIPQ